MAERKPAKKATPKSARSSTAIDKRSEGFSAEERAAMKQRAQELKAPPRRGPRADVAISARSPTNAAAPAEMTTST